MIYLGDFAADATSLSFNFNTRKLTGEPVNPTISTIDVYKDGVGAPLSLEFDSLVWGQEATGHTSVHLELAGTNDDVIIPGHDYTIVLSAGTVDGTSVAGTVLAQFSVENRYTEAGGDAETLAAIKAKTDTIGAGSVTVTSPVTATGDVTIIQGDTYSASEVAWTDSGNTWPADLDTATSILCCIADEAELACTYAADTITLDALSCVETAALAAGRYPYWLEAQWDGDPDTIKTIGRGTFSITHERPEVTA